MSIHMNSRNGSFGFQVFGGADVGCIPEIELVVPGEFIGGGWGWSFGHIIEFHYKTMGCKAECMMPHFQDSTTPEAIA